MSTRTRLILFGALSAIALLALAGFIAWKVNEAHDADLLIESRTYIPSQFQRLRESPGHVAHGEAHVACASCHNMQDGEVRGPKQDVCIGCHNTIATELHEAKKGRDRPGCLSCHHFTPGDADPARACLGCHGENARSAQVPPVGAHQGVPCLTCHLQHEAAAPLPAPCPTCHEDKAETGHGAAAGLKGVDLCMQCHLVHEGARYAPDRCAACHAEGPLTVDSSRALFPGGHELCIGCHVKHTFTRETVSPCVSCHKDVQILAAAKAEPHQKCESCHKPHNVKAAASSCVGCHAEVVIDHPAPEDRCISCHRPHPDKDTGALTFQELRAVACVTCHDEVSATSPPHDGSLACRDCHEPHKVKLKEVGIKLCGRCHKEKIIETAVNRGHADCAACHKAAAHTPRGERPACASCHEEQGRTAVEGHADCGKCHTTHSGALQAGLKCATCHEVQAATRHGQAVECGRCHRPHGPRGPSQPPGCTTCHEPAELPGLHGIREHQECARCHGPHEAEPRADRASCTTCHEAQRQHEPKARVCKGCHVFRR